VTDPPHFVDANIPMYAAGAEHPLKRPCLAILEAIARGQLAGVTSVEILQEILHRYSALGQRTRAVEVAGRFLRILPAPFPVTLADLRRAMELLPVYHGLQARDALHVAVMENQGVTHIVSADQHFDGVAGIVRVDPMSWSAGGRS
jgi:predicted nucleic acid-binding protein